jgi:hypothetical protein
MNWQSDGCDWIGAIELNKDIRLDSAQLGRIAPAEQGCDCALAGMLHSHIKVHRASAGAVQSSNILFVCETYSYCSSISNSVAMHEWEP